MKRLLCYIGFGLLILASFPFTQMLRKAFDDLDSIANDLRIIRYNLAPASAMRGEAPPEKVVLPEESPKDITL